MRIHCEEHHQSTSTSAAANTPPFLNISLDLITPIDDSGIVVEKSLCIVSTDDDTTCVEEFQSSAKIEEI